VVAARSSLHLVAPVVGQQSERFVRLHSFGHDPEAEGLAQRDRRADDGRVVRVAMHVADERPVDLQLPHGQPLQQAREE
jgi:hypothetical protein